jgi:DNA polymerase-1
MKFKTKPKSITKINTLLIDGEGLLKQGFYGAKQVQMKHGSVGTIFHFINTIKRFYQDFGITKVVAFWEGKDSKLYRQCYYPYYKKNREDKVEDLDQIHDLDRQRVRVKQYLEELFIRQVEIDGCEADDGIAYYVRNSPNENKLIYTNDRDLLQLIAEDTKVYLSNKKAIINQDNFTNYFDYHYKNVGVIKMLAGDSSDNISGLENIGEIKALKLFPELKKEPKTADWILERTNELLSKDDSNKALLTIKEGKTKWGVYGNDYFLVMGKVINLETPNVTDDLKAAIKEMVEEYLIPDGRGGVNTIVDMMKEDEILTFLPKYDDGFFVFWSGFITIINKEKKLYEQSKKTENEHNNTD